MAKFKKRPEYVEAAQWRPGVAIPGVSKTGLGFAYVNTPAGNVEVHEGDWVITQEDGLQYVLCPEEFEKEFEPDDGASVRPTLCTTRVTFTLEELREMLAKAESGEMVQFDYSKVEIPPSVDPDRFVEALAEAAKGKAGNPPRPEGFTGMLINGEPVAPDAPSSMTVSEVDPDLLGAEADKPSE